MKRTRRSRPRLALAKLAAFLGTLLLVATGWHDAPSAGIAPGARKIPKPSERLQSPAAAPTRGIWISHQEIQALPMSGPAWDALEEQADLPAGTPNVSDQDQMNNVYVLAKALVHVRTGIESYRTEVRQNCIQAIDTELGGRTLALGRELAAYVIAADLVGLEATEDSSFRAWLRRCLTETLDGRTLQSTHEGKPNNWGTMAGGSRAAVAAYLGDSAELVRTAQVFKGWLGDRSSYAGFDYGELSWQCDPTQPVGINPPGCIKQGESIDGALPDDMRRGCSFTFPPCHTGYIWGALQGVTVAAEILHRAGYDTWNWQDQAIRRAIQFMDDLDRRYGGWWAEGNDECVPWIVNRAYGTNFTAVTPAEPGKIIAWMDWTHGAVTDPVAVEGDVAARGFALPSSHPNPFRARTTVRFELPRLSKVRLTIYDLTGRAVRTLVDGHLPAGAHEVPWDPHDETGRQVGSGVYLLRFEAPGFAATRRLVRMR